LTANACPSRKIVSAGSSLRIQSLDALRAFRGSWKFHHPLADEQLAFADRSSIVASVGYYHGGDVLYRLRDVPGIWHEGCLKNGDEHPA
jgi:hypothetical protein